MQKQGVTDIAFLENYIIDISFAGGHRVIYNLEPKLKTARFRDLMENDIFYRGKLVGNLIRWTGNIEISLEEILIQVGKTPSFEIIDPAEK